MKRTIVTLTFPAQLILSLIVVLSLLLWASGVMAHELWVLTPEQAVEWNARPKPEIFTQFNASSLSIYLSAALCLVGCLLLYRYTASRTLASRLRARLISYGDYAPVALRIALFIMLGTASLGLAPRLGTGIMQSPVLGAPDLELRLLPGNWSWVAVLEGVIAVCLLLGIYVRGAAVALLGLGLLGLFLFGEAMCAYIGLVGAAAVYLLFQGAGPYAAPLPSFPGTTTLSAWFASQPRERVQCLMRLLVGADILYLGLAYKFAQPNLMLGVLDLHHVPTMGMAPETFVLVVAVVETLAGAVILAGIMIRPVAVGLFVAFAFFSVVLWEGVFSHIVVYGLLVPLITNGAGQWHASLKTKVVLTPASWIFRAGRYGVVRIES
ncbi:MAG: hypothetical protein F9K13_02595 [Candidatus Methylomirabilis oxygeniifera]|uniref:DoxX family protein n=1 Tax=Methylomirabilis oxygeniifera TaxID=671143 RepID=D5MF44_METO1|nr:MAG: hypothetical protein F9K13_02595 [Candidatus Methylomirabilis oxyfera]CBE68373.1 conserved membrane protein of unknown function [Candidatus Methylomirabilis oxyfera]